MKDKVYIIAEVGINHEGSIDRCIEMIEQASLAGADAVKLQTVDADVSYVIGTESHRIFKGSELTQDETARAFDFAKSLGMDVFTTCGDIETARWVDELNPSAWKVSSGLLTHIPLIIELARFGRPMFVSTGMGTIEEVGQAIEAIRSVENEDISIFQCTSLYPAPNDSLNLSTISLLKKTFGCRVGFSDHSIGVEAAFLSVGAGAKMIEKHFTFDVSRGGFDHSISLDANGFREMVDRVRQAEVMMGGVGKDLTENILSARKKFLRAVVATRPINKGQLFTSENIAIKRPLVSERISPPSHFFDFIGKVARRDIEENETIVINEDCDC